MSSQNRLAAVRAEYRQRLLDILGDDLYAIILYGSQARGDAVDASDIDVLCVMKNAFDYGELIDRTCEASAEISLKHDVVISTAFVTRFDYENRNTPFLMNVRREGLSL